jgi:hypothetical protein
MGDPNEPNFGYDPDEHSMFVECRCGWRSSTDRRAGTFSTQWDRHVERVHAA